jgi:hypothetical protein
MIKKYHLFFLVITKICAQMPFKTGINFPFYVPNAHSISQYLELVEGTGTKFIRQMNNILIHDRTASYLFS